MFASCNRKVASATRRPAHARNGFGLLRSVSATDRPIPGPVLQRRRSAATRPYRYLPAVRSGGKGCTVVAAAAAAQSDRNRRKSNRLQLHDYCNAACSAVCSAGPAARRDPISGARPHVKQPGLALRLRLVRCGCRLRCCRTPLGTVSHCCLRRSRAGRCVARCCTIWRSEAPAELPGGLGGRATSPWGTGTSRHRSASR